MHSHVLYSYLIKCGLKFISCLQVHKLPETSHTNYTHPCDSLTNLQLKLWPQTVELTPSGAEVTTTRLRSPMVIVSVTLAGSVTM